VLLPRTRFLGRGRIFEGPPLPPSIHVLQLEECSCSRVFQPGLSLRFPNSWNLHQHFQPCPRGFSQPAALLSEASGHLSKRSDGAARIHQVGMCCCEEKSGTRLSRSSAVRWISQTVVRTRLVNVRVSVQIISRFVCRQSRETLNKGYRDC
jgi:hypothetical protein